MGVLTVLWYELQLFKKKFVSITSGSMISPLLYLVAFGWGLGSGVDVNGMSYMNFVIPGIIGMTTMTVSFSTVGNSLNISRMYNKTFEEFMTSPIKIWEYALGKIIAGAFRGMYSAALMIIFSLLFNPQLNISIYFIFLALTNCLVFAALGFMVGMLIDSHTDMNKFTSFIITPMSFLSGTFFPIDKMPFVLRNIIYYLPLAQSTSALRSSVNFGDKSLTTPLILFGYFLVFLFLSIKLCKKAE
ncbi:ABC transporter permease [Neofamilia massiliensis]|uniref:ABC transporter permease n=1 Tax=Neofamilia massiliensis TaxID=1673724 RepID=UPI0006BB5A76|nr:ABC transporter permease [Neofamilia massiliensis]